MPQKITDAPKLFDYNGDLAKEWYVQFRRTCPDTGIRKAFQNRFGINYLTTRKERYEHAAIGIKSIEDALSRGWNPFKVPFLEFLKQGPSTPVESSFEDIAYHLMPLSEALNFALEKRKPHIAPKTFLDYQNVLKFCLHAARQLKLHTMPIGKAKRPHIKLILEQMGKDRQQAYDKAGKGQKFTGNNYNKYKRHLSPLFDELVEHEALEYNPCNKIKAVPEIKTNKHRHATIREEDAIKAHLKLKHPNLLIYLAYETLSGLRPKEILAIRICDIDWFNGCFDVFPTEGRTKSKEARKVPIPDALLEYITEQKLENHNPDHYIFSNLLVPGPVRLHRNTVTWYWDKYVKKTLNLDVTLYSFKGLGGEKKRQAGISHGAVQKQFGHRSAHTTNIYLHNEREREFDEIKKLTPKF